MTNSLSGIKIYGVTHETNHFFIASFIQADFHALQTADANLVPHKEDTRFNFSLSLELTQTCCMADSTTKCAAIKTVLEIRNAIPSSGNKECHKRWSMTV